VRFHEHFVESRQLQPYAVRNSITAARLYEGVAVNNATSVDTRVHLAMQPALTPRLSFVSSVSRIIRSI